MGNGVADEVVRCRGLAKVLGGRRVLDGIDLTVNKGEVFGFLGPNGAGKTTTIRLLLGLSRFDGGEAYLFGARVPVTAATLARVGRVPSYSSLGGICADGHYCGLSA